MTAAGEPYRLTGRRILVTGASSGIGRATALAVAGLGALVTVNGRDTARLTETLAALPGDGHRIAPFDLADADAVPAWLKAEAAAGGPFAGVAHCAGQQTGRPVRAVDRDFFDRTMHVNLLSAVALARGLRQKGCHAESCSMVLVASVAAMIGQPGNVVYSASKGGLVSATRGLAMELLRDGIRVNCVAPAMVETGMMERFRRTTTSEQFDAIAEAHPMGFGRPEDVAAPIAFLLSDAARWINGAMLPVDGGYLAR
jgi:NAD(P)-dependent dehydrogenase (short-subunit alcohol dehydrogenase family)